MSFWSFNYSYPTSPANLHHCASVCRVVPHCFLCDVQRPRRRAAWSCNSTPIRLKLASNFVIVGGFNCWDYFYSSPVSLHTCVAPLQRFGNILYYVNELRQNLLSMVEVRNYISPWRRFKIWFSRLPPIYVSGPALKRASVNFSVAILVSDWLKKTRFYIAFRYIDGQSGNLVPWFYNVATFSHPWLVFQS